jgi:hypothetical protein
VSYGNIQYGERCCFGMDRTLCSLKQRKMRLASTTALPQ